MGFFSCFFYNLFVYCCCFPNIIHLDQLCINCYIECETEVCGFTGIPWGGGGGGVLLWCVPVRFSLYRYSSGFSVTNYFTEHSEQ